MEKDVESKRQLGLATAVLIIIADVIGTGIFVTTGGILNTTQNAGIVLLMWAIGGFVVITGSLCYAELASIWPDNGGEYIYLKNIYGKLPAFLTGWLSLAVGFSASVAITALAFGDYLNNFIGGGLGPWSLKLIGAGLIFIFGVFHILGVKKGSIIQNILTIFKLFIIFAIIVTGFYLIDWNSSGRLTQVYVAKKGLSVFDYSLALLIIMFAYSGWNGANYIAGEIKNPEKNLPKALLIGTVSITAIYLLLNVIFLMSTPGPELMKTGAVGAVAMKNLLGGSGNASSIFTISIALILLSSVSVQMMVGPRVYQAMAKDRILFKSLGNESKKFNTPVFAIIAQMFIGIIYVLLGKGNLYKLMQYMGFALSVFPLMAIGGLIYIRYKRPELKATFRVPFLPVIGGFYILLTVAMMAGSLVNWSKSSLFAIAVVAAGIPIYYIWKYFTQNNTEDENN